MVGASVKLCLLGYGFCSIGRVAQRLLQGEESRAVVVARSLVRADIQDLHDLRVLEDLGLASSCGIGEGV